MTYFLKGIGCCLLLATGLAVGQTQPQPQEPSGLDPIPQGLHFQAASASAGYSSSGLVAPLSTAGTRGADYYCAGMLSIGYTRSGETRTTLLTYDAEYLNRLHYSNLDAFIQRLRFFSSREVRPRWTLYVRMWASDSMIDQLLLTPTGLDLSGTDQAAADQIGAGLTSTEQAHAAANASIFGSRTLDASVSTGVLFRKSARLRYGFHLAGDRTQGLSTEAPTASGREPLLPQATTASARADMAYAISPRTDFGVSASTIRTFSRLSAFYLTDLSLSVERRLSVNWFASIIGGGSVMRPVRAPDPSRDRQIYGYNAGGTLGRRTRTSNTFVTVTSTLGDSYGFGGRYSDAVTVGASWFSPRRSWGVLASGYAQRMRMQSGPGLSGWQGLGEIVRSLGAHFAVTLSYAYLQTTIGIAGPSRRLEGHSVQTTLSWLPLGAARMGRF